MAEDFANGPIAPTADMAGALAAIDKEIRAGLIGHTDRLDGARDNFEYYHARNIAYIQRRESEEFIDFTRRPKRTSRLTRKVIRKLSEDLYNPGPNRRLENGAAEDAFVQEVYRTNNINALMQQADRQATLNAACAIQVVATGRPEKPICLYPWGAHEFVPFFTSDDHLEPWAIATISLVVSGDKKHQRIELWTKDLWRVYTTKEVAINSSMGGSRAEFRPDLSGTFAGQGANPYGVLPFTFVHDEPPVTNFWEGGIGTALREANGEIDREMSDLAQHVQKYLNPDGFLIGVSPTWRSEKRPGGWQHLKPGKDAEGDAAREPKAMYVQAQLAVQDAWFNIMQYTNCTLEELDVPLIAVRDDASTDLSGIAIVAKHIPLLGRTKSRQVPFASYETALAKLILSVAGNYYSEPRLQAAAAKVNLSVVFPPPSLPLPTPERDQADLLEIEQLWSSELQVVQKRFGMTRDQALDHLRQVAQDKKDVAAIWEQAGIVIGGPKPGEPEEQKPEDEAGNTKSQDGTEDDESELSQGLEST